MRGTVRRAVRIQRTADDVWAFIGDPARHLTVADIRYDTWAAGLTWYANEHLKFLAWYHRMRNERTLLPAFSGDLPDDVFTARMQLRF